VDIEFVASMSVIASEPSESRKLFARLQSVDALIIGISYAPWLHD
jgi:hypothetical protein